MTRSETGSCSGERGMVRCAGGRFSSNCHWRNNGKSAGRLNGRSHGFPSGPAGSTTPLVRCNWSSRPPASATSRPKSRRGSPPAVTTATFCANCLQYSPVGGPRPGNVVPAVKRATRSATNPEKSLPEGVPNTVTLPRGSHRCQIHLGSKSDSSSILQSRIWACSIVSCCASETGGRRFPRPLPPGPDV